MTDQLNTTLSVRKLVARLVVVTVVMFGFGFALVPLYDLFCDVTGLNGKTNSEAFIPVAELIDTSRNVTVQFIATNNENMSWEFHPE
ncbi:MAG: cytochrome c oxidase assembly protein, partial [Pseudomonadales bacterium]